MKIILGLFDRQVSYGLAAVLSGKKITPIEAESSEEISALLSRHQDAVILTEEISSDFHSRLRSSHPHGEVFLLTHKNVDSDQVRLLRSCGLRGVIPYTEDVELIAETLLKYLALLAQAIKKEEPSYTPSSSLSKDVGIYLQSQKSWIYGSLVGFNSSKVAVSLSEERIQESFWKERSSRLLLYLQGLKIKAEAEPVFNRRNLYVFRYCQMSKKDQEKLAYYLYYCGKNQGQTVVY